MNTQIITACRGNVSDLDSLLAPCAEVIKNGGLVVFPTETVYGLGGDATNSGASEKIYAAKGRPSDNPLIIHISDPKDAAKYAVTCPLYEKLARAFMPGPLTVVMPRRPIIPLTTTGGLETVAVRCPSHPVARALIRLSGVPIAAPSANISGKPSPTCAEHVVKDMAGKVEYIIDGGECDIGLESTIVSVSTDPATGRDYLTLLRPGGITYDALCCVCERVDIADAVINTLPKDQRPLSPGMKYKHYAPQSPVILLDGNDRDVLAFLQREQTLRKCAVLCFDEEVPFLLPDNLLPVGPRDDVAAHAHLLFARLRESDALDIDVVYAHLPPKNGLGLALYNRMIRAAAHTVKKVP